MPNYRRAFLENSYVFLTITTYKRQHILIENINLLRESFKRAKSTYEFQIYASAIMPDHMHLILLPENIDDYPKIIFAVKYHLSRNVNTTTENLPQSMIKKGEKGIWQRRYYEHTIRNEESLYRHLDYIHYNPVKHGYVDNVKDWEFSSFHKFVKQQWYDINWVCSDDIKEIRSLNLE